MLSHAYKIVIDYDIGLPVSGKDVVDSLNATNKFFLLMLITAVQISVAENNNSHMVVHTSMINTDISRAREF